MGTWKSWVLTDLERRIWVETFTISSADLDMTGDPAWSIKKTTLRGGLSDGVDLIEVNNGAMTFFIIPTRGMGIWRGRYHDIDLGWNSPVRGPVHPAYVHPGEHGGLGWLTGFDEMIVRCGLASNGAPGTDWVPNNTGKPTPVALTLHGHIANLPAQKVEVRVIQGEKPRLEITGEVIESGLFLPNLRLSTRIVTECGSHTFSIHDTVTNQQATEAEMELLYHCNFGRPLLEEKAQLEIPTRLVAPRDARAAEGINAWNQYDAPAPGVTEQCYWFDPIATPAGNSLAMLRNADADKGVVIRFNTRELPAFTQWKNTASERDGYVTGLEPGTDFPNSRDFERKKGRLVTLAPGQEYNVNLACEVHDTAAGVAAVSSEIQQLQQTAKRQIAAAPLAEYSDIS